MYSEAVDWSLVSTAYGPAVDLPHLFEQLSSPDEAERRTSIDDLWGCLCHQGTVYTASAAAVPYLLELAQEAPLTSLERSLVLALIAGIGRGEDTCWDGYTPWPVVEECAAAVDAVVPAIVSWAVEGRSEARPWAVVLATYFPATFRGLGVEVAGLLTAPDADLVRLVAELAAEIPPESALVGVVAARNDDTQAYLQEGMAGYSPTRQGRHVVWDLAEKELL